MTRKYKVIARDFDSTLTRDYIFTSAFHRYPELLGLPKLILFPFSEKGNLFYLNEIGNWQECHEKIKDRILKRPEFLEELINNFLQLGVKYAQWAKEVMGNINLYKKADKELLEIYREFYDKQAELYALGVLMPVLDFQEFSFVENNLKKILKKHVSKNKVQKYYNTFTTPSELSFSQEQELELLELAHLFYSKDFFSDLYSLKSTDLKNKYPEFFSGLERHAKKYAWVYYVYAGPAFNAEDFLDFLKSDLMNGITPSAKIKEINQEKERLVRQKKEYSANMDLSDFEKYILKMAGKVVWAKPRRKDYQSQLYYYAECLQKILAKRMNLTLNQVRSLTPTQIEEGLLASEDMTHVANSNFNCHVCLSTKNGQVKVLTDEDALLFKKKYIPLKKINNDRKEFRGQTAYGGQARGVIKLINIPSDMTKMDEGDILLSVATTPAIVLAMKKAGAIITDEGGLTCHASIVSRELKKPCVVGLGDITNYLKDGDMVEVDAEKGIIKRL